MTEPLPGRTCPVGYRYGVQALAAPAALRVDTLWVAGGLYGNLFALERLLELYRREPGPKALVFNGDFHWFDIDADDFARVNGSVLEHCATRGNVETELASPARGAGCGCGYPDWVGDDDVARSNRIIERLRETARRLPEATAALAALPMHLVAQVGPERVGVVHGDADSLAGWGFSQELLARADGARAALEACARARVRVFASSHSCLPVLQRLGGGCAIINNGAAGMPNFAGTRFGVATRISTRPGARALYRARAGQLTLEAVALEYDAQAWQRAFLAHWPPGSDAHRSYYERIVHGPRYAPQQALRPLEMAA
ncbi:MAG TPA: hypothetical protein VLX30_09170 [Burkholderiales bacterium]|nr:hypothetical protein [Burkholderiales bacterium]